MPIGEESTSQPQPEDARTESGVADALRTAVERTMRATAGSAATTRDRATELVDEVVRRGRDARDELARRGQEAGVGLARRGQEATGEIGRRVETLERRLAELEHQLREGPSRDPEDPGDPRAEVEMDPPPPPEADPEAEG